MRSRALLCIAVVVVVGASLGCATPRMMAIPSDEVGVDPSGKIATHHSAGLILHAAQADAPSSLSRRVIAFRLTITNPSDQTMEFIPKEYALLDQYNRQFFPLGPDALLELAGGGARPTSNVFIGYGWGRPSYYSHGYFGYRQPFYWYDYPYPPPRRSYQGLIARSLPIGPIGIQPRASVSGILYFPVPISELRSAELRITRFLTPPEPDAPLPQQAVSIFRFSAIQ